MGSLEPLSRAGKAAYDRSTPFPFKSLVSELPLVGCEGVDKNSGVLRCVLHVVDTEYEGDWRIVVEKGLY